MTITTDRDVVTKKKVYIAGPYTKGDVAVNVRTALEVANRLADAGFVPYVPHMTHFWHLVLPRPYKFWCDYDNEFLSCCDILLRIPGDSDGADREVKLAYKLGLRVYFCEEDLWEDEV